MVWASATRRLEAIIGSNVRIVTAPAPAPDSLIPGLGISLFL